MHPMGMVLVDGYSRYLPYYKSALDKLYIDYNVWTVGEYKSFVEPITRDDMSPQDEEASRAYLGALWNAYQADVTTARKLPGACAAALRRRHRDAARPRPAATPRKLAVDYGLVDELLTRDAMRERIREAIGEEAAPAQAGDDYTAIGARRLRPLARSRGEACAQSRQGGRHRGRGHDPRRSPAAGPHRRRLAGGADPQDARRRRRSRRSCCAWIPAAAARSRPT